MDNGDFVTSENVVPVLRLAVNTGAAKLAEQALQVAWDSFRLAPNERWEEFKRRMNIRESSVWAYIVGTSPTAN
jgi:hypothetical protein